MHSEVFSIFFNTNNTSMKRKSTLKGLLLLTLLSFLSFSAAWAQDPLQIALKHISENREQYKLTAADISDYVVTDQYVSKKSGITHIYLRQRYRGIEVEGALLNINIDRDGHVINMGSRFIPDLKGAIKNSAAANTPVQAVQAAARSLDLPVKEPLTVQEEKRAAGNGREVILSRGGISLNPIPARLMYQPLEDGSVKLAWIVSIYSLDAQHYWNVAVDASSGEVLKTEDQVIHDFWDGTPMATDAPKGSEASAPFSGPIVRQQTTAQVPYTPEYLAQTSAAGSGTYRVLDVPFETPNHGERSLVSGKENQQASPLGWHNDGLLSYTITRGNNVFAYEDRLGANAGTSPDGGAELVFDFPIDYSQQPTTYVEAATTNLFYWNNLMHDVFYQYGFDEVSGNFQHTNFTGEGKGLDAVSAEAQDGGGTNNANFLTLQDGIPGRMQMYLWTSAQPTELLFISSPDAVAGAYIGVEAAFGKPLDENGVSGQIIMADPANGCSGTPALPEGAVPVPFNNQEQIAGNIALVDRGSCTFVEKALNAQTSGATAVIVVNNVDGNPIAMGGGASGETITIPAIMISKADGDRLKTALAEGLSGTLKREGGVPPMKDGDLDNGIIAHEYGHGISIRLTGGPSTQCLSGAEQGGEGWSDFFGLYMTMQAGDTGPQRRGIGTYVRDEEVDGNGIRPAPYSTDMSINSYTYGDIANPEISVPHGVGFIWATMLWDMTWNLIDEYGYDPDIYNGTGGNNLALQLIIDGLKLQPCSPGFVDMRDAILAADQIHNGGENQCYIWRAFAKRGLGYSAEQGSSRDLTDGVVAFDLPPSCQPNMAIDVKANPSPVSNGAELTYTISVRNDTEGSLNGVQITDPLPDNTSFVSATDGSLHKGVVKFKPVKLREGETIERSFTVKVNTPATTVVLFSDDMESGDANWTTFHDVGVDDWKLSTKNPHSGNTSWFAVDPNTYSNQSLILKSPVQLGENSLLRFWHDYATEDTYDGGVVEISTNGGISWEDLGDKMIQNGYNSHIPLLNASTVSGPAFSGNSGGYIQTIVDLSSYSGQSVQIRFRMGSDVLVGATGWYVDDVDLLINPTFIVNTAIVDSKQGGLKSKTIETMVVEGDLLSSTSSLQATAEGSKVVLNFTANDMALTGYVLEKSENGFDFMPVAIIEAGSKSSEFSYTDKDVKPGKHYYYRSVKAAERHLASQAVEVEMPELLQHILYPNPVDDRLNINFGGKVSGTVQLEITNVSGQTVLRTEMQAEPESGSTLDVSGLSPGMYFIIISTADKTSSEKIMIQH